MPLRNHLALLAAVLALPGWPVTAGAGQAPARPVAAIAIIVHRSNPVNELTRAELRRIFMLETQTWPHGRKITLVLGEKGQADRPEIIRLVCGFSETDYDRHVLLQTFRGQVGLGPRAIRSPAAMVRFVFNAPGAIGYVRADQLDGSTKVLRIDGLEPTHPAYPLRLGPLPDPPKK